MSKDMDSPNPLQEMANSPSSADAPGSDPLQSLEVPQDDTLCWVCGGPVIEHHCKIVCQVCGFTRD
ncbi:MAG: hypothetical protein P8186_18010, partial [Anaerolineae bacterium]